MKRRDFIVLLGGAGACLSVIARAQNRPAMATVGVLATIPEEDPVFVRLTKLFTDDLEKLGWADGKNIRYVRRAAFDGKLETLRSRARELIAANPDVIVASNPPAVTALRQETSAIPLVFWLVDDPVGRGFVQSIARPGGNITGFMLSDPSLGGKWLQALKELAPGLSQVAVLFNPTSQSFSAEYRESIDTAARAFEVRTASAEVHDAGEIEQVMTSIGSGTNAGVIVLPDAFTAANRATLIAIADERRLPVVYPFRLFTVDGGLFSYGVVQEELFRQAASYVDRILRGAKPADLPVQSPKKFELVLNLKTAKAMGLTVPPLLLARADEVIE
jgi:putative tryptophan/tyrosine transport system substrate-binding protein